MPETLRFHDGQAYLEASNEEPYPVKVLSDPQSRNVIGSTSQVAVGTTATLIAPANPNRRSILLTGITGTQITYIGFTNSVSSTTGHYVPASVGANVTIFAKGAIFGIAASSAQTFSVLEEEIEAS